MRSHWASHIYVFLPVTVCLFLVRQYANMCHFSHTQKSKSVYSAAGPVGRGADEGGGRGAAGLRADGSAKERGSALPPGPGPAAACIKHPHTGYVG